MVEQKPMGTNDAAEKTGDDRQRRAKEAAEHMKDATIAARVRAAHPNIAENDEALKVALADYDRLAGEQSKA